MFCETIFMRKRIPWSRRLSKGVLIGFDDELFGGSRLFDPGTGEQGDEMTKTISRLMALLFLAWPSLTGLQLPASGPLPDKRPESAAPAAEPPAEAPAGQATRPEDVPTPQDKPTPPAADPPKSEADDGNAQDAQGPDVPPKAAEPAGDAKGASPPAADGAADTPKKEETAKPQPPPIRHRSRRMQRHWPPALSISRPSAPRSRRNRRSMTRQAAASRHRSP